MDGHCMTASERAAKSSKNAAKRLPLANAQCFGILLLPPAPSAHARHGGGGGERRIGPYTHGLHKGSQHNSPKSIVQSTTSLWGASNSIRTFHRRASCRRNWVFKQQNTLLETIVKHFIEMARSAGAGYPPPPARRASIPRGIGGSIAGTYP